MIASKEQRLQDLEQLKTMSDQEVAEFWDTHDFADYAELMGEAEIVATPKTWKETMTFRLDADDVAALKAIAENKGIGATTLVRMIVKDFLTDPNKISLV